MVTIGWGSNSREETIESQSKFQSFKIKNTLIQPCLQKAIWFKHMFSPPEGLKANR